MREAVRIHLAELPLRVDVVLHPRRLVLDMEFTRLEREVSRVFLSVEREVSRVFPTVANRPEGKK